MTRAGTEDGVHELRIGRSRDDGPVPIGRPRAANFDVLRLVAATSVIFSHSFMIAEGHENNEPFVQWLGQGNIVGLYGVFVFFVISGYLITGSWYCSSPAGYLLKRCARIFPGLIACAFLVSIVAYVMAGLVLGEPMALYETVRYFARTVLLYNTAGSRIAGLTFSELPRGGILNGSLWTIGPEFLCYLALGVAGLAGVLSAPFAAIAFAASLATKESGEPSRLEFLMCYFWAGCLLYHWKSRPALGPVSTAVALAGLGVAAPWAGPHAAFAVFGAYLVVALGTSERIRLPGTTRFGDLTYGLYLYGWPVGQVVRSVLGSAAAPLALFLVTLPIAAVLAFLSWHGVEKPALRLAHRVAAAGFRRRPPSAAVPPVGSRGD